MTNKHNVYLLLSFYFTIMGFVLVLTCFSPYISSLSNPFSIKLIIFFLNMFYDFDNSPSWIKKFRHLVSSKYLAYLLIFRSNIRNRLTFLSSAYLIKYLNPFQSYEILLDTTIFSIFTLFILFGHLEQRYACCFSISSETHFMLYKKLKWNIILFTIFFSIFWHIPTSISSTFPFYVFFSLDNSLCLF